MTAVVVEMRSAIAVPMEAVAMTVIETMSMTESMSKTVSMTETVSMTKTVSMTVAERQMSVASVVTVAMSNTVMTTVVTAPVMMERSRIRRERIWHWYRIRDCMFDRNRIGLVHWHRHRMFHWYRHGMTNRIWYRLKQSIKTKVE